MLFPPTPWRAKLLLRRAVDAGRWQHTALGAPDSLALNGNKLGAALDFNVVSERLIDLHLRGINCGRPWILTSSEAPD